MSVVPSNKIDLPFELLDWDSSFFGFGVAKLCSTLEPSALAGVLAELKKQNVRLVYWPAPAESESCREAAAQSAGFMAGCQVLFEQFDPDLTGTRDGATCVEYTDRVPDQQLIELALTSGQFSRYNDPQFSRQQFADLYRQWITNCTARKTADHVLIDVRSGRTAGMVCTKKREFEHKIVLIAVGDGHQGAGIGTNLVKGAIALGKELGCTSHSVVTYWENEAACKLFAKCGYLVKNRTDYYHFWL